MVDWLTSNWTLAMLALLVLSCIRGGSWRKVRVWAALVGSSAGAWLVTPEYGSSPFLAYIALCIAGAVIVLVRPASLPQRAIGKIFAVMALFHFGALWAGHPVGNPLYYNVLVVMGWAQFAILAGWTFTDGFGKALGFGHDGGRPKSDLVDVVQKGR